MLYFGKEWYKNGCKVNNNNEINEYYNFCEKNLPKWYNENFSIHDSKIIDVKYNDSLIVLTLIYDDCTHQKYEIRFANPTVIEECDLLDSWCISDEIHFVDNFCEFHLMCDTKVQEFYGNLSYFTVKCTEIQIVFKDNYCVINGSAQGTVPCVD